MGEEGQAGRGGGVEREGKQRIEGVGEHNQRGGRVKLRAYAIAERDLGAHLRHMGGFILQGREIDYGAWKKGTKDRG